MYGAGSSIASSLLTLTPWPQYIAAAEIAARRNAERLASSAVEYYQKSNHFFLNRLRGGKRKAKEESEDEDEEEEEEDEDESDEVRTRLR